VTLIRDWNCDRKRFDLQARQTTERNPKLWAVARAVSASGHLSPADAGKIDWSGRWLRIGSSMIVNC
jgi:hypothetical protein